MAQKKSETVATNEKVIPTDEESTAVGSFVITFWDRYEQSRERAQHIRENREDAYINVVREVIQFNKQYRKSIARLYDQTKKTNKDVVSELMRQFNTGKEEVQIHDREELKNQLKEVSGQLEKFALTPIKSFFNIVDQLEDNFEKNAKSSVAYARDRRNAWFQVRKEYVKKARNTHLNLVERGRNSFKELVKTQN